MKVLLWAPTDLSALLSLRALAFVAYQGLNGAAFEEEEIISDDGGSRSCQAARGRLGRLGRLASWLGIARPVIEASGTRASSERL